MLKLTVAIVALFASGNVLAACYGSGAYKTCTDSQGNSYTVQKIGNQTTVQGRNAQTGSTWSQSSQRIGNSTYTQGRDQDGNPWNATTTRIGRSSYTYGRDSDGRSFNSTTSRIGNSTHTYGRDSDGNAYSSSCVYNCDDE